MLQAALSSYDYDYDPYNIHASFVDVGPAVSEP